MPNETLDYTAILADLEAKKAALEQAIMSVRAAMGAASGGDFSASMGGGSIHNGEVPAGAFFGKSIPEAAKLYLQIVKRKQNSKEIAEGLKQGGMESTSKNFVNIVHSGIDRASKNPTTGILKLGKALWGLTEWYPRGVASAAAAPKNAKKKNKAKRVSKASDKAETKKAAAPAAAASVTPAPSPVPKPQSGEFTKRVVGLLSQLPSKEFTLDELGKQLGAKPFVVKMQMQKLVKNQLVEKTARGFRALTNVRQMPAAAAAVV
jgi:hypothetical protein